MVCDAISSYSTEGSSNVVRRPQAIMKLRSRDFSIPIAIVLSMINVAMIWEFRFLPLHDFPIWIFETKILSGFSNGFFPYSTYYDIIKLPVPNLGLTALTWFFSRFVSFEAAGKVFLSLCLIGFPWSWFYAVRSLVSGRQTGAAFLGFPFSYNLFMFGGQGYVLGLSVLLLLTGLLVPRFERFSLKHWLFLSCSFLVLYFLHAIPFGLSIILFITLALVSTKEPMKNLAKVLAACVPSSVLAVWYIRCLPGAPSEWQWGIVALGRNVLKPMLLFIKSYGISSPVPITVLNALWLGILFLLALRLVADCRSRMSWDKRFVAPMAICGLMMLFLPYSFLNVVSPGGRLALPFLFFFVCLTSSVPLSPRWVKTMLITTAVVVLYNAHYFSKVNRQVGAFYEDIIPVIQSKENFYVIGLDWPAGTSVWDQGSASINPLILTPYYAYLQYDRVAWIFQTGLLRLKDAYSAYQPPFNGDNIQEFESSVFGNIQNLKFFHALAVAGNSESAKKVIEVLEKEGYRAMCARELWTVMERP